MAVQTLSDLGSGYVPEGLAQDGIEYANGLLPPICVSILLT
jgi:hypothetical protein